MRKTIMTSVSLAAFLLGAATARADDSLLSNTYISLFGGYTIAPDTGFTLDSYTYDTAFKDGFTVGGAYGGYLTQSLRGEIELSYQRYSTSSYTYQGGDDPDPADGYVSAFNVLLNVWKDIDVGTGFTPYVGAGIGVGVGRMSIDWAGDDDEPDSRGSRPGFASQLGAGVRMAVSDRTMVDLGYRFRSLFDVVAIGEDFTKANYFNHTFQAGVTYALGDGFAQPAADLEPLGSGNYFTVFGGVAVPESSAIVAEDTYAYELVNKTGFTVGAALGTSVAPGLRAEIEASYTNYSHDYATYEGQGTETDTTGETGLFMVTANVWKDIPLGLLAPYAGGGVGVGIADSQGEIGEEWNDTRLGLALQFGGGVRFAATNDLLIDVGYRARGVLGATLQGGDGDNHGRGSFLTHTAQIGVTYGGDSYATPAAYEGTGNTSYVSLFGGVTLPTNAGTVYSEEIYDINFKTGFTVGAAVGTEIMDTVRGELEVSYSEAETCGARSTGEDRCDDSSWEGDVSTVTIMTNVWKDFGLGMFNPYVGGGVGLAVATTDIPDWEDSNLAMAAQVGAGVRFAATDNLSIDVGYRFKGVFEALLTGRDLDDDDHGLATFYSHHITGGVSWGF